jgi:hypothetical protein
MMEGPPSRLRASLEIGPPVEAAVGRGAAFAIAGRCHHPDARIAALEVEVGRARSRLSHRRGGFAGAALVPAGSAPGPAGVSLVAHLAYGKEETLRVGEVRLEPALAAPTAPAPPFPSGASGPRVAVCMASFDPPPDLFRVQLDSIREQSHANWVCVISDDGSRPEIAERLEREVRGDERFLLVRGERRGFYSNFERALALAPDCDYLALSDQDDRWRPDKLERLLAGIGNAELAYSDARIVRPDGTVVQPSYWSVRAGNHTDLTSLLLANSVTGAATLFGRELLEDALPFPPAHAEPFHDHWLALVALARGRIAYVDEPLYDYVQHGDAVIGHAEANRPPRPLSYLARKARGLTKSAREIHDYDWLQLQVMAHTLQLRCGPRMPADKRRELGRFAAAEGAPGRAAAWLLGRWAPRRLRGRKETLDRELYFAYGLLGRRLRSLTAPRRPAEPTD